MKGERFKFIITTVSGNIMEWYDFALYGYFATVIAKLFFPSQNEFFSLLMTFGVFASGFIARPLGGVIFGHIGDRYGRRVSLLISIALIILPTALIGVLPTYTTIGVAAPILLTICRLLQGIAVSGELTGSGIFLIECAPNNRKGFYGSLVMCSTYLGLLIGAAISVLTSWVFNETQLSAFAWRIPFIISFFFGIGAIFLRVQCQESPVYRQICFENKIIKMPVINALKNYPRQIVLIGLVSSVLAVAIYLLIGYFPSYFVTHLKMSLNQSMAVSFVGLFVLTLCVPLIGWITDRVGALKIFGLGAFGFLMFSYAIFHLLTNGDVVSALLCVVLTAVLLSPIAASILPIITGGFPPNVRCSGVSIGYNLSMSIFGGTTPLVAMYSCQYFKTERAPYMYLILCALLTLVAIFLLNNNKLNKSGSLELEKFEIQG